MAGDLSNFLADALAAHVLGRTTYTAPATLYVGLWISVLTPASTGSSPGEVTGGGYARQAIGNTGASFTTPGSGQRSNAAQVSFPVASANWGTVLYAAILDALTGGNILWYKALGTPQAVGSGGQIVFNAGDIDWTVT